MRRQPAIGRLPFILLAGWLLVAGLSGAAEAEPDPETVKRARAIAEQGFAAFDRKGYAAAIALFEKAYQLAPAAGLLYNIAQSYRQIGPSGCARALEYYRRYLEAATASGAKVEEAVRARIAEMEACLESQEAEPEPPADAGSALEPNRTEPGPAAPVEPGRDPSARRSGGRLVTGIAMSALGAIALGAAGVTGAMALQRESELSDKCGADNRCSPDLAAEVASYDRLRITAMVTGAVGVGLGAAGTWLLLTHGGIPGDPASRTGGDPSVGVTSRPGGNSRADRVSFWVGPRSLGLRGAF